VIKVNLPDGRQITVDTVDPAAAAAAAKKFMQQGAAPPTVDEFEALLPKQDPGFTQPTGSPGIDVLRDLGLKPTAEEFRRGLQIGVQGVGEGFGNLLGFPGDIESLGRNAIDSLAGTNLRDSSFFSPSEQIQSEFGDVLRGAGANIIPEAEMSPQERIAKSVNALGTEALTGSAGAIRAAGSGLGRAVAKPVLPQELIEAAQKGTAGRTLAGDTAAGAGAGFGLGAAQETGVPQFAGEQFGPAGETIANLIATLAGGTAGNIGARAALPSGRTKTPPVNAVDPQTGKDFSDVILDTAAFLAQREADNPVSARSRLLDRADELKSDETFAAGGRLTEQEIPTSGQLAGDQGLAALEKTAHTVDESPFRQRDAALAGRTRQLLEDVAPEGEGRAFTEEFESRASQRRAASEQTVREAQAAEDAFAGERRAGGDELAVAGSQGPQAAKAIDEVVSETTAAETTRKNENFRDPDIAGESRGLDFLQEAIATEKKNATPGIASENQIPVQAISEIKKLQVRDKKGKVTGPGSSTVAGLQDIRGELARIQADARKAGNVKLADSAGRIKSAIADDFAALADEGGPAGIAAQKALDEFAERFGPTFRRGKGDPASEFQRAFAFDKDARTSTPQSKTAGKFLVPGSPERAQSLARVRELSPTPEKAIKNARKFLLADAVTAGVIDANTGAINGVRLGKWRQKWGDDTLNTAAPGFADEIGGLVGKAKSQEATAKALRAEVKAAADAANLDEQEIAKGALSFALGRSPEKAVGAIFGSGDPQRNMAKVVSEIGDNAEAKNGLKQSVREWLLDTRTNAENGLGDKRPVNLAKLSDLFEKHTGTLSEVFEPAEMNSLRQVHRLLRDGQIVKATKAVGGSDTTPRAEAVKKFERGIEAAFKLKFGVLKGGGLIRSIKIAKDALPGETFADVTKRALTQMFLDPELAAHLLIRDVGPRAPAWNARLQRLIGVGESVRAATEDDEQSP